MCRNDLSDEFTAYTKTQESRLNWGTMSSICIMDAKFGAGKWIIDNPSYYADYDVRYIRDFGPEHANDKILVAELISIIHEFERIYGMKLS